jgi:hypothetical protein
MGGQLWAKIALNLADNPKVIGLSDSAFRAFVEAILYSRQHLTDGFLDARVVAKRWGLDVAAELTSNDPQNPSWVPVDGGFQLHNFCEYQMTNEDVDKKREAQRLNGIKSGEARRAKAEQNRTNSEPTVNQNELESESESESETETEQVVVSKPTRKTELQPDWKPSPAGYEYAKQRAPGMNADIQAEKFVNYNLTQGRKLGDWEAAWRNWVLKAIEFDPLLAQPLPPPKRQFTGEDYDNDF